MRMTRQIMQRHVAQLAAIIRGRPQDWIDFGRRFCDTNPFIRCRSLENGRRRLLISICFLVSFIAADAWMSRRPTSLESICWNVLELYKSRDKITDNEKMAART